MRRAVERASILRVAGRAVGRVGFVCAAAILVAACGSQKPSATVGIPTPAAGGLATTGQEGIAVPTAQPEAGGHSLVARPGQSVVAAVRPRLIEIYREPKAGRPFRAMANPVEPGVPLVFLVKQAHAGWLEVYVPVRPDGTTGWIRASHVRLLYDPYSVKVSLGAHRLTVSRKGTVVDRQRISVGQSATPTPRGVYYITALFSLIDPSGPYGPYAFGLSGFSNVLRSFGGGPGQLAIHGTNDPGGIGSNVSHGCIHVLNAEITRLARELPLGTPVQIKS
jgi:lipoprotein-anchoring transpeptidase ErfK/SrfK